MHETRCIIIVPWDWQLICTRCVFPCDLFDVMMKTSSTLYTLFNSRYYYVMAYICIRRFDIWQQMECLPVEMHLHVYKRLGASGLNWLAAVRGKCECGLGRQRQNRQEALQGRLDWTEMIGLESMEMILRHGVHSGAEEPL